MRDGRCFRFRRVHAALCTGGIVAGMILVPSVGGHPLQAVPLAAFDSNGRDDSFVVAQSRPQGRVIKGSTATQSLAGAMEVAAGDPVAGSFGPQVAWPIMPIHAVLLPDGRVMSYGTDTNGVQTAYYQYDVWNPNRNVSDAGRLGGWKQIRNRYDRRLGDVRWKCGRLPSPGWRRGN